MQIYINEKPIILGNSMEKPEFRELETIEWTGNKNNILDFIEAFENYKFEAEALFIFSSETKKLTNDFLSF